MIAQQRPLDDLHIPPSYLNRRIQGPKRLQIKVTGEDYRKLSKTLDEQGALDPNDADKTKINIAGIQKKWDKYYLYYEFFWDKADIKTDTVSLLMSRIAMLLC